jgi:DNA polymerase I-like protein with 3'-5' exonuclease and polymerase domains
VNWREALDSAKIIACDIEIANDKLACFGFATDANHAYVIPASKIHLIKEVCEHPVPKIWANGKFDLFFLKYRCGIVVEGEVHDVMAAWFSLYPELAGAKQDKKKRKMTRKSLSFLASLFTLDAWWKGDYSTEHEFFIYNGKDCCITFDIWEHLEKEMQDANCLPMYEHVRLLIWPCVDMLGRGLLVDSALRERRLELLEDKAAELREELQRATADRLGSLKDSRLFENTEPTCRCCRHAKNKQARCWGCAGFNSAPSKAELVSAGGDPSEKKQALEQQLLGVCKVCGGKPRRTFYEWNPASHDQNKVVLYELLKLPKRFKGGKLRSDEEALKGIMGVLGDTKPETTEIIRKLLLLGKSNTMAGIYKRILPADDGRIHSDQSPYGTETSRFSHSETFLYVPGSTNLANLPKKTAGEELYRVRDCIIPEPGRKLVKADYSAAEARWCAWMANDTKRIRYYEAGTDLYKVFVALLKWDDETRWEDVGKLERNVIGKVGILSGQYGVSWKTLLDNVNADADITGIAINAKTAKKMVDIWDQFFPETIQWHARVREQVLSKGYMLNPYGFKRYFFARRDSSGAKDALVREAIAFGPQSANAMMLNKALRELYYKHDPSTLRVLLQVHDEIVLDCLNKDFAEVVGIVKSTMEHEFEVEGRMMLIPAEIEVCNTSWSDARRVA